MTLASTARAPSRPSSDEGMGREFEEDSMSRLRSRALRSFPVALVTNYLQKPLEPGRGGGFRIGSTEIPLDGSGMPACLIGYWTPTSGMSGAQGVG